MQTAYTDNDEKTMIDYGGIKRLTPQKALNEIKMLRDQKDMTINKINLLNELENYLLSITKRQQG